jgi:hypothetical protein
VRVLIFVDVWPNSTGVSVWYKVHATDSIPKKSPDHKRYRIEVELPDNYGEEPQILKRTLTDADEVAKTEEPAHG